MKITKLKEIVLFLLSVVLSVFLIKYLHLISYVLLLCKIMLPVFIGFLYAWFVNPLVTKMAKKKKRSFVAILLFLLLLLLISFFFYLLIPTIYREVNELVKILPDYFNMLEKKVYKLGFYDSFVKFTNYIMENTPLYLVNLVKKFIGSIGVLGVGLFLGLYMSIDYDRMIEFLYKLVPKKIKCVFITLTQSVSTEVRKCIKGTLLVASMVFVGDSVLFFLIKLDAPLLLGMVCGLTDLIPYIGPYIGGAIAVSVGFTESKMLGFLTLIVCVIVQSIENFILQPIVMSKSIKISPIFIIIGMLFFSNLFGILGMIIATPIVAVLKCLFDYFVPSKEKCKE